ncbi:hypothetical protein CEXT_328171 [Caerostris extrusa]|uniref:Uncharacterized protein n=1 Tax=Caerostris extrusa TaxID=172846 RepID=A0AAV4XK76_CAEEX|nr:hypothetical protein CEXT_328171 [Caerostris extrusa]
MDEHGCALEMFQGYSASQKHITERGPIHQPTNVGDHMIMQSTFVDLLHTDDSVCDFVGLRSRGERQANKTNIPSNFTVVLHTEQQHGIVDAD